MKTLRIGIFVLVAVAQLAVPASVAWKREQTFAHGRIWKLKTAPVDPVDVVRGRYIWLQYAISEFAQSERADWKSPIYVVLKEDPDGFAQVDHISQTPVSGDNVVQADAGGWSDGTQRISFPFRNYWVTEKIAPRVEQAYRENSRRGKENAYVTLRVRNGDAALEQLFIDNQPLADYLRVQDAKK
jgi:uncharacterized membrane-anchored protein